jgi:MSHA biogenesis protein MshG
MPRYVYKARNRRREALSGEIEADSVDQVALQLRNSDLTPISIELPVEQNDVLKNLSIALRSSTVSSDELVIFCRALYSLTRASIPIVRALDGLAQSTDSAYFTEILEVIVDDVEAGQELNVAFARHPHVFPPLFINIVRVGENSGKLDEALLQLSDHLELDKQNRRALKSALRYPSIVLATMVIALVIINIFVIPAFAGVFEGFGAELPLVTKILLGFSNFSVEYWPQILGVIIVAVISIRTWVKTELGRYSWDRWKLKIPLFGNLILRGTLGRFARSLGLASQSGVPLLQGLTLVAGTLDNAFLEERVLSMRTGIEHGESLSRTAVAVGVFTPLVVQMFAVGEETGMVDRQLLETAEFYEREVAYQLKTLTETLEPAIIVGLGIMVLVLALGIFLPMWDLSSVAG